ncbi:pyrimidine utilization protein C [soil metagenome]
MPKTTINPPGFPPPLAPYSLATRAGDTVYVSGVLAMNANGTVAPGDVRAQTRFVIESIRTILIAAGGNLSDIANNAIFLKSLGDYAAFNEVYREYFGNEPPARHCIRADLVREEFLVEIASTAHIPLPR